MAVDLSVSAGRLAAHDVEFRERLDAQAQRLEAFALTGVTKALDDMHNGACQRLSVLEDVVKQADFERLRFAERMDRDLRSLRDECSAAREWSTECVEAASTRHSAKLDQGAAESEVARRALEVELQKLGAAHAATTKDFAALTQELSSTKDLVNAKEEGFYRTLEAQSKSLREHAEKEAGSVLGVVRGSEGARIGDLEQGLREASAERREEVGKLVKELAAVRSEVLENRAIAEQRLEATTSAAAERMVPVTKAIDDLAQGLRDVCRTVGDRDGEFERLEHIVRKVEVRRWPWRSNMRQRSSSPPGTPAHARGTHRVLDSASVDGSSRSTMMPDNMQESTRDAMVASSSTGAPVVVVPNGGAPAGWPRAPHPPASARPASASGFRRREEQALGDPAKDGTSATASSSQAPSVPMVPGKGSNLAAGPAFSIARVARLQPHQHLLAYH